MRLRHPHTGETVDTYGAAAQRFRLAGWVPVDEPVPVVAGPAPDRAPTARTRRRGPGRPRKDGSWPTQRRQTYKYD